MVLRYLFKFLIIITVFYVKNSFKVVLSTGYSVFLLTLKAVKSVFDVENSVENVKFSHYNNK